MIHRFIPPCRRTRAPARGFAYNTDVSYQTYTTDALICGSYDRLTADRTYRMFTESTGMVFATARSAREERSKQRYALQDFALVRVSLVRGKSGWRVGSVEPLQNYYLSAPHRAARGTVVAVVNLLRRLVAGEEAHPAIFADTVRLLSDVPRLADEVLAQALQVYTLRTLAHLGYVAEHQSYQALLDPEADWVQATAMPATATKAITDGLAASHL
jgi:recombinational DNA repair protein (RecF pathway)